MNNLEMVSMSQKHKEDRLKKPVFHDKSLGANLKRLGLELGLFFLPQWGHTVMIDMFNWP